MMYHNVDKTLQIHYELKYALTASVAALICTVGATVFSCYRALAETPASLMRPPAPKEGRTNPSGADAVPLETSEFYMEILSSKSVPLQETSVYDSFRNCRKYGTDAGRLRNTGFDF